MEEAFGQLVALRFVGARERIGARVNGPVDGEPANAYVVFIDFCPNLYV
jgi:hypothetical protein